MDVKEALLKADTYLCGDAPPCYSEQVAVTLAAEVRRRQWIPVGERLPDINEPVALLNIGRFENCDHGRCIQDVGYLSDTYYRPYWSVRGQSAIALDGYTHWMPLPEPPEGA